MGTNSSAGISFLRKKTLHLYLLDTNESIGEKFAEWAKGARAVKAFNTIGNNLMENPKIDDVITDVRIFSCL